MQDLTLIAFLHAEAEHGNGALYAPYGVIATAHRTATEHRVTASEWEEEEESVRTRQIAE